MNPEDLPFPPKQWNFLAVVPTHEEGKKTCQYICSEQLAFPYYEEAERRLYKFFQANPHYLFTFVNYLEGNEAAVVNKVVQHFYNNFGPYFDNLLGTQNLFDNLIEITTKGSYINKISGANRRALIIGAGPSLDSSMEELKKLYDAKQGFIICLDASYRKLLNAGIKPHIVISSERVAEVAYFYEGLTKEEIGDTIALFNLISHPPTVESWPGTKAFYSRKADEYEWLKAPIKYLETTPYTTFAATSFAYSMGFKEIVFVGQDFAYGPKGESHANLEVSEKFHGPRGPDKPNLEVEGVGETPRVVQTTKVLNMFAQEVEQFIQKNKEAQFVNTSKIGRRIAGTIEVGLERLFSIEAESSKIELIPFPLSLKDLLKRVRSTLKEFKKTEVLDPRRINEYRFIPHLAYHFLIHPFTLYNSMVFQTPENEEQQRGIFNQTWGAVREDLIRILEDFIESTRGN